MAVGKVAVNSSECQNEYYYAISDDLAGPAHLQLKYQIICQPFLVIRSLPAIPSVPFIASHSSQTSPLFSISLPSLLVDVVLLVEVVIIDFLLTVVIAGFVEDGCERVQDGADNGQDKRAPWQIAICAIRDVTVDGLRAATRSTGSVSARACQDSNCSERANECQVEGDEDPPKNVGAFAT